MLRTSSWTQTILGTLQPEQLRSSYEQYKLKAKKTKNSWGGANFCDSYWEVNREGKYEKDGRKVIFFI